MVMPGPVPAAVKRDFTQRRMVRKLSRPAPADIANGLYRVLLTRVCSAVICLVAMLLAAWIGALARILTGHDWRIFRMLDPSALETASRQAGIYQADLLPVLLVWAALLIVTPNGFAFAHRSATVVAGILGYLHFSAPSFFLTSEVASISHWLSRLDNRCSDNAVLFLIVSVILCWVLISNAARTFSQLGRVGQWPFGWLIRKQCALVLAALVLFLAVWAAIVIRPAASHQDIRVSDQEAILYLLALILLAVLSAQGGDDGKWLAGFTLLASVYALAVSTAPGPGQRAGTALLIRIGAAWGADLSLTALFLFIPAGLLGVYLVGRILD
jgi:hypothetical protein